MKNRGKIQKILFMGEVYPKHLKETVLNKSSETMQIAADELQWNIIAGLEENISAPVDILNMLPVNSYPRWYSDWYVKKESFSHVLGANDMNIGFINITKIKYIFKNVGIVPYVRKWYKRNKNEEILIINYTLNNGFLKACRFLKHKNPGVRVCVIIADLPEMANLSSHTSVFKKIFNKMRFSKMRKLMSVVDYYALLTKQMADYLKITKPFCVIEGVCNAEEKCELKKVERNKKIIAYTGTLHSCFGIKNLVDAFGMISSPYYELIICGIGDSENYIRDKAKDDPRIRFLGQVSHEKVIEIQNNADVLVNPRQNIGAFTKYSFPSKTMEYLVTGTPVIAYKLAGIPDEYDQYLNYVCDNSIESLRDMLIFVCESSDRTIQRKASEGRNFVIREKNPLVQSQKILSLCRYGE